MLPRFKDNLKPTTLNGPSSESLNDSRFKAPPRQLTVWLHDSRLCSDEVVVDINLLPPGTREGDIAELRTINHGSNVLNKQRVLFVVKNASEEMKRTIPNFQVSREGF